MACRRIVKLRRGLLLWPLVGPTRVGFIDRCIGRHVKLFLLRTQAVKIPSNNKCHSPRSHDLRGLEKATLADHLW